MTVEISEVFFTADEKRFRDEPVVPFRRHWLCTNDICSGEMIATGYGVSTEKSNWLHRCDMCGSESWTTENYPMIAYRECK